MITLLSCIDLAMSVCSARKLVTQFFRYRSVQSKSSSCMPTISFPLHFDCNTSSLTFFVLFHSACHTFVIMAFVFFRFVDLFSTNSPYLHFSACSLSCNQTQFHDLIIQQKHSYSYHIVFVVFTVRLPGFVLKTKFLLRVAFILTVFALKNLAYNTILFTAIQF